MAKTELPKWVWDIVIALQRHEDEHDAADRCYTNVLRAVPRDVRDQAAAIGSYAAQVSSETQLARATAALSSLLDPIEPAPE